MKVSLMELDWSEFSIASPRSSVGGSRAALARTALLQGASGGSMVKRPAFCLETSAKGEDLQTGQAALAGAKKFYIKNPLEHYIPPFRVWTGVWHCTFTDRRW
ncbi:translation initiation factor IF-2-like [Grus japonensis]|uniref:Translation initiation factor IF-2-like n=1 Tax=Grus japonensis TaxID=30415 RepID=A0ABC9WCD1_GRUJA